MPNFVIPKPVIPNIEDEADIDYDYFNELAIEISKVVGTGEQFNLLLPVGKIGVHRFVKAINDTGEYGVVYTYPRVNSLDEIVTHKLVVYPKDWSIK